MKINPKWVAVFVVVLASYPVNYWMMAAGVGLYDNGRICRVNCDEVSGDILNRATSLVFSPLTVPGNLIYHLAASTCGGGDPRSPAAPCCPSWPAADTDAGGGERSPADDVDDAGPVELWILPPPGRLPGFAPELFDAPRLDPVEPESRPDTWPEPVDPESPRDAWRC